MTGSTGFPVLISHCNPIIPDEDETNMRENWEDTGDEPTFSNDSDAKYCSVLLCKQSKLELSQ